MNLSNLLDNVSRYYTNRIREHGATHWGVDWNSNESQDLRFKQLLRVCVPDTTGTIGDFGCGYGALFDYLTRQNYPWDYRGFDISSAMIDTAAGLHGTAAKAQFSTSEAILSGCDYVVASGVFNVKQDIRLSEWEEYYWHTIDRLARLATRGFAFNALTSYSDPDRMRADLYYPDPCIAFDRCKRLYSRHVALLHDYGLYEFTILVRF